MAVDFEIPTERIEVGKGGFDVRGVDAETLVFITSGYLEDIKKAVARYGLRGRVPQSRLTDVVLDLAKDFPSLAAEIISRCADAPDQVEKFRRLGYSATIKALLAIFRLSSEDGGVELKNLGAGLVALLESNGVQLGPLATHLKSTIETSENTSAT